MWPDTAVLKAGNLPEAAVIWNPRYSLTESDADRTEADELQEVQASQASSDFFDPLVAQAAAQAGFSVVKAKWVKGNMLYQLFSFLYYFAFIYILHY